MCKSNTKCTVINQSLTGDYMSLDERKLMFIHFLYQGSGTEEEYSELVQLLEDVTTYQSVSLGSLNRQTSRTERQTTND